MKMQITVFALLLVAVAIRASPVTKDAPACESGTNCVEPACRCATSDIPQGFAREETPQIVMLTFDDAINTINIQYYRQLYEKYSPGNGCNVGVTYFTIHEYNDYSLLHEVYTKGHDISVHSITHKSDTSYWATATEDIWSQELVGMRQMASTYGAVPIEDVQGDRTPFLQPGGDQQFKVLNDNGFIWDSSLPTQIIDPPLWPYTLDFKSNQDCEIAPCPVESYNGFWVMPMVDYKGGNNASCSMVDQCQPAPTSPEDAADMFKRNFHRHYDTNRAPFGVYTHAAWFQVNETNNWGGYLQFIDYLGSLPDVYIVNIAQAVEWMKTPTRLADIGGFQPFQCIDRSGAPVCTSHNCHYTADKTPFNSERYMVSCANCPPFYPWLGNVDGLLPYPPPV